MIGSRHPDPWLQTSSSGLIGIVLACLAFLLLGAGPALCLEDGRIGVLYIGCIARSRPFWVMRDDPLFQMTFVQATLRDWAGVGPMPAESESDVHRMVRIYMPRTHEALVSNYDVIVLSDANVLVVGPHIAKLAQGVSEGGLGLFMGGGWESFGGTFGPPWGETLLGQLLPTRDIIMSMVESVQKVVVDRPEHELIRSLPWNWRDPDLAAPIKWHHNPVALKPGADLLAHVLTGAGQENPLMVTWRLGDGARVFAITSEIHRFFWQGGQWGNAWTYGIDLGCNLMIYLDDRPVPQDVDLARAVRSKMFEVATRRSLLMALLDFCESFGANTQRMVAGFDEMDEAIAQALPEYLDLRFEAMLETYDDVDAMLAEAEQEAVKLKNRTLLWVHVIEWLAVTGTAMVAGFVVWSLMVRRRLYQEVRTTRFAGE